MRRYTGRALMGATALVIESYSSLSPAGAVFLSFYLIWGVLATRPSAGPPRASAAPNLVLWAASAAAALGLLLLQLLQPLVLTSPAMGPGSDLWWALGLVDLSHSSLWTLLEVLVPPLLVFLVALSEAQDAYSALCAGVGVGGGGGGNTPSSGRSGARASEYQPAGSQAVRQPQTHTSDLAADMARPADPAPRMSGNGRAASSGNGAVPGAASRPSHSHSGEAAAATAGVSGNRAGGGMVTTTAAGVAVGLLVPLAALLWPAVFNLAWLLAASAAAASWALRVSPPPWSHAPLLRVCQLYGAASLVVLYGWQLQPPDAWAQLLGRAGRALGLYHLDAPPVVPLYDLVPQILHIAALTALYGALGFAAKASAEGWRRRRLRHVVGAHGSFMVGYQRQTSLPVGGWRLTGADLTRGLARDDEDDGGAGRRSHSARFPRPPGPPAAAHDAPEREPLLAQLQQDSAGVAEAPVTQPAAPPLPPISSAPPRAGVFPADQATPPQAPLRRTRSHRLGSDGALGGGGGGGGGGGAAAELVHRVAGRVAAAAAAVCSDPSVAAVALAGLSMVEVSVMGGVLLAVGMWTLLAPGRYGRRVLRRCSPALTLLLLAWNTAVYVITCLSASYPQLLPPILHSLGLFMYNSPPPVVLPFAGQALAIVATAGLAHTSWQRPSIEDDSAGGARSRLSSAGGSRVLSRESESSARGAAGEGFRSPSAWTARGGHGSRAAAAGREWADRLGLTLVLALYHVLHLFVPISWILLGSYRLDLLHAVYLLWVLLYCGWTAVRLCPDPRIRTILPPIGAECTDGREDGGERAAEGARRGVGPGDGRGGRSAAAAPAAPAPPGGLAGQMSYGSETGPASPAAPPLLPAEPPAHRVLRLYASIHLLVLYGAMCGQLPGLRGLLHREQWRGVLTLVGIWDPARTADCLPLLGALVLATAQAVAGKALRGAAKAEAAVAAAPRPSSPPPPTVQGWLVAVGSWLARTVSSVGHVALAAVLYVLVLYDTRFGVLGLGYVALGLPLLLAAPRRRQYLSRLRLSHHRSNLHPDPPCLLLSTPGPATYLAAIGPWIGPALLAWYGTFDLCLSYVAAMFSLYGVAPPDEDPEGSVADLWWRIVRLLYGALPDPPGVRLVLTLARPCCLLLALQLYRWIFTAEAVIKWTRRHSDSADPDPSSTRQPQPSRALSPATTTAGAAVAAKGRRRLAKQASTPWFIKRWFILHLDLLTAVALFTVYMASPGVLAAAMLAAGLAAALTATAAAATGGGSRRVSDSAAAAAFFSAAQLVLAVWLLVLYAVQLGPVAEWLREVSEPRGGAGGSEGGGGGYAPWSPAAVAEWMGLPLCSPSLPPSDPSATLARTEFPYVYDNVWQLRGRALAAVAAGGARLFMGAERAGTAASAVAVEVAAALDAICEPASGVLLRLLLQLVALVAVALKVKARRWRSKLPPELVAAASPGQPCCLFWPPPATRPDAAMLTWLAPRAPLQRAVRRALAPATALTSKVITRLGRGAYDVLKAMDVPADQLLPPGDGGAGGGVGASGGGGAGGSGSGGEGGSGGGRHEPPQPHPHPQLLPRSSTSSDGGARDPVTAAVPGMPAAADAAYGSLGGGAAAKGGFVTAAAAASAAATRVGPPGGDDCPSGGWLCFLRMLVRGSMEAWECWWLVWGGEVALLALLLAAFTSCSVVSLGLLGALGAGMVASRAVHAKIRRRAVLPMLAVVLLYQYAAWVGLPRLLLPALGRPPPYPAPSQLLGLAPPLAAWLGLQAVGPLAVWSVAGALVACLMQVNTELSFQPTGLSAEPGAAAPASTPPSTAAASAASLTAPSTLWSRPGSMRLYWRARPGRAAAAPKPNPDNDLEAPLLPPQAEPSGALLAQPAAEAGAVAWAPAAAPPPLPSPAALAPSPSPAGLPEAAVTPSGGGDSGGGGGGGGGGAGASAVARPRPQPLQVPPAAAGESLGRIEVPTSTADRTTVALGSAGGGGGSGGSSGGGGGGARTFLFSPVESWAQPDWGIFDWVRYSAVLHAGDLLLVALVALVALQRDLLRAGYLAHCLLLFRRRQELAAPGGAGGALFGRLVGFNFLVLALEGAFQAPWELLLGATWDLPCDPIAAAGRGGGDDGSGGGSGSPAPASCTFPRLMGLCQLQPGRGSDPADGWSDLHAYDTYGAPWRRLLGVLTAATFGGGATAAAAAAAAGAGGASVFAPGTALLRSPVVADVVVWALLRLYGRTLRSPLFARVTALAAAAHQRNVAALRRAAANALDASARGALAASHARAVRGRRIAKLKALLLLPGDEGFGEGASYGSAALPAVRSLAGASGSAGGLGGGGGGPAVANLAELLDDDVIDVADVVAAAEAAGGEAARVGHGRSGGGGGGGYHRRSDSHHHHYPPPPPLESVGSELQTRGTAVVAGVGGGGGGAGGAGGGGFVRESGALGRPSSQDIWGYDSEGLDVISTAGPSSERSQTHRRTRSSTDMTSLTAADQPAGAPPAHSPYGNRPTLGSTNGAAGTTGVHRGGGGGGGINPVGGPAGGWARTSLEPQTSRQRSGSLTPVHRRHASADALEAQWAAAAAAAAAGAGVPTAAGASPTGDIQPAAAKPPPPSQVLAGRRGAAPGSHPHAHHHRRRLGRLKLPPLLEHWYGSASERVAAALRRRHDDDSYLCYAAFLALFLADMTALAAMGPLSMFLYALLLRNKPRQYWQGALLYFESALILQYSHLVLGRCLCVAGGPPGDGGSSCIWVFGRHDFLFRVQMLGLHADPLRALPLFVCYLVTLMHSYNLDFVYAAVAAPGPTHESAGTPAAAPAAAAAARADSATAPPATQQASMTRGSFMATSGAPAASRSVTRRSAMERSGSQVGGAGAEAAAPPVVSFRYLRGRLRGWAAVCGRLSAHLWTVYGLVTSPHEVGPHWIKLQLQLPAQRKLTPPAPPPPTELTPPVGSVATAQMPEGTLPTAPAPPLGALSRPPGRLPPRPPSSLGPQYQQQQLQQEMQMQPPAAAAAAAAVDEAAEAIAAGDLQSETATVPLQPALQTQMEPLLWAGWADTGAVTGVWGAASAIPHVVPAAHAPAGVITASGPQPSTLASRSLLRGPELAGAVQQLLDSVYDYSQRMAAARRQQEEWRRYMRRSTAWQISGASDDSGDDSGDGREEGREEGREGDGDDAGAAGASGRRPITEESATGGRGGVGSAAAGPVDAAVHDGGVDAVPDVNDVVRFSRYVLPRLRLDRDVVGSGGTALHVLLQVVVAPPAPPPSLADGGRRGELAADAGSDNRGAAGSGSIVVQRVSPTPAHDVAEMLRLSSEALERQRQEALSVPPFRRQSRTHTAPMTAAPTASAAESAPRSSASTTAGPVRTASDAYVAGPTAGGEGIGGDMSGVVAGGAGGLRQRRRPPQQPSAGGAVLHRRHASYGSSASLGGLWEPPSQPPSPPPSLKVPPPAGLLPQIQSVECYSRPPRDFYAATAVLDLVSFAYAVVFYQLVVSSARSLADITDADRRLPLDYLFALMLLFAMMVSERAIYMLGWPAGKMALHLTSQVVVLGWCLREYWRSMGAQEAGGGGGQGAEEGVRSHLRVFVLLRCLSFCLGAMQLRDGYPPLSAPGPGGGGRHASFFYARPDTAHWVAFNIFYSLPFLYEIRMLLDWTCISTSLDWYSWLKLEDIRSSLFVATCRNQMRRGLRVGERVPRYVKFLQGVLALAALLLVLWLPPLLFSSGAPTYLVPALQNVRINISIARLTGAPDAVNVQRFPLFSTGEQRLVFQWSAPALEPPSPPPLPPQQPSSQPRTAPPYWATPGGTRRSTLHYPESDVVTSPTHGLGQPRSRSRNDATQRRVASSYDDGSFMRDARDLGFGGGGGTGTSWALSGDGRPGNGGGSGGPGGGGALPRALSGYTPGQTMGVCVSSESDRLWQISPPSRRALLDLLEDGADVPVVLEVRWSLLRSAPLTSQRGGGPGCPAAAFVPLSPPARRGLAEVLSGRSNRTLLTAVNATDPASAGSPGLFPLFLRLKGDTCSVQLGLTGNDPVAYPPVPTPPSPPSPPPPTPTPPSRGPKQNGPGAGPSHRRRYARRGLLSLGSPGGSSPAGSAAAPAAAAASLLGVLGGGGGSGGAGGGGNGGSGSAADVADRWGGAMVGCYVSLEPSDPGGGSRGAEWWSFQCGALLPPDRVDGEGDFGSGGAGGGGGDAGAAPQLQNPCASAPGGPPRGLSGPGLVAVLEPVQSGLLGATLSRFGITGLYVTFVFAIGRFLRLSVSSLRLRIPTEDLPSTRRLVMLCQDIYVARAEGELVLEDQMFRALITIYRSPQLLFELSRKRQHT